MFNTPKTLKNYSKSKIMLQEFSCRYARMSISHPSYTPTTGSQSHFRSTIKFFCLPINTSDKCISGHGPSYLQELIPLQTSTHVVQWPAPPGPLYQAQKNGGQGLLLSCTPALEQPTTRAKKSAESGFF
ncbi:hypothetical protein AMECASPLE_038563 [Ameca splendens]|uniref:Uncharacterized protein n=1 Tax=Ameca splendens TaxID=208324 RepID=A0ABV0YJN1_9TELE